MKFLIYMLISLTGFGSISTVNLTESPQYILDKQSSLLSHASTGEIPNKVKDSVSLDKTNEFWDKITIEGNTSATYQIKGGTEAAVVELPDKFVDEFDCENITNNISSLSCKGIKAHDYLYLEYNNNHPIRVYTDNLNPNVLHIDIAKSTNPYQYTVVLDPGHGGKEAGASYANINEKAITLDIAKKMENKLKDSGINVIYTRTSDSEVPLIQRCIISNEAKPDAFISIHNNANKDLQVSGITTYTYKPSGQASEKQKLAASVQGKLTTAFPKWSNWGILQDKFCVLHRTDAPSILVEFGFLSNAKDRTELCKESVRDEAAGAIANGIVQYLHQ